MAKASMINRDRKRVRLVQKYQKKRDELKVGVEASSEKIESMALQSEKVQAALAGKDVKKVIVVPGRLVNVVG